MILYVLAVNATDYHTYCNNPDVGFEIWQLRKEGNYDLNMGLFVTQTRLLWCLFRAWKSKDILQNLSFRVL